MTAHARQIFKSSQQCRNEVRELLQGVFLGELMSPSHTLWIVSPWVSDIVVVDNRSGGFDGLLPEWGPREIRLREVLGRILTLGGAVVIATRSDDHNQRLLGALERQAQMDHTASRLIVHLVDDLHEKGICGDSFYLSGSMNLTYNGVELLEETIRYEVDSDVTSRMQITYRTRWGSPDGR